MAHSFFGGVRPKEKKGATAKKSIEQLPAPQRVVIALPLPGSTACRPLVTVGEQVKVGQIIGERGENLDLPIHTGVSGTVVALEERTRYDGAAALSAVIENDGEYTLHESIRPAEDPDDLTAGELVELVRRAGIVGMGGAARPTWEKITAGMGRVDTVIINAAECEPYVTGDHRLMLEHPDEVLRGAALLVRMFRVDKAHIGIDDNKMNAAELLRRRIAEEKAPAVIDVLHARYPQGAEEQMCRAITGRRAVPGEGAAAVGCAVFNVATVVAISRAVYAGMPSVSRVVTVSGSGVRKPKNLECPVGTPLSDLIACCGGLRGETYRLIVGGPMMGLAQADLSAGIEANTGAVLGFAKDEDRTVDDPACIRCGKCVFACPMGLQPLYLYIYEKKGDVRRLEASCVSECIECGACDFICPGRLELAEAIRAGKARLCAARAADGGEKEG